MSTGAGLRARLDSGAFALTAEIGPPRGADPEALRRKVTPLAGRVDAVNITDNAGAHVRMASWAGSLVVAHAGVEPVMQLTCRDRNRLALQSDLLAAAAMGIPNVLLMTGDHPRFGDHPGARPVFDLDSVQLLWAARMMREEGRLLSGRTLSTRPAWFIGAVENPFAPPTRFRAARLAKKADAGAEFVQTQFVFDVPAFARWMAEVCDLGLDQRCRILAGVGPVRSLRALDHMRTGVPGLHIPGEVDRRLRAVPADQVSDEGVRICTEIIEQVREIPGVSGVHVMAPGYEHGIPAILERAGLAGPRDGQPGPQASGGFRGAAPPGQHWPEASGAQGGRPPGQQSRPRRRSGVHVLIDVRPVAKLTGPAPVDVAAALAPVFAALAGVAGPGLAEGRAAGPGLAESSAALDLASVRVVCDWIQYRHNFYDPVEVRPVLADRPHPAEPGGGPQASGGFRGQHSGLEIGIDLRRCGDGDLAARVTRALAEQADPAGAGLVLLEPWQPASESCLWRFNTLYWQALSRWEEATGREYEQALPGGRSEASDTGVAGDLIRELLRVWDELDARRALPEELYVAELGVGNGSQARTWLDTFADLDAQHGRDYYRRLHYLMGDYSAHVLDRARKAVSNHGDKVSTLVLDATRPQQTLGFLRGKAFCVYISNVYDNLPTDDVASIRGHPYLVEVRACLRRADAVKIARRHHTRPGELAALIHRLLRLGPDLLAEAAPGRFPGTGEAVAFWQETWSALRLQERYVPLDGVDAYQVTPDITGEILRPLLETCGDVRMHVSNGALASFAGTLPLLHPFGRLQCHDLFLTAPGGYLTGFHGPGKYDGSVVNWVNGPLLALAGNRRGFDVQIAPSRRPGVNVKTLTAQVRD